MTTTTTNTTQPGSVRALPRYAGVVAATALLVAGGVAVLASDGRFGADTANDAQSQPAMTSGLSQEQLEAELEALHSGEGAASATIAAGLSQDLLAAELAVIHGNGLDRRSAAIGAGLSQGLLAAELAAIHGEGQSVESGAISAGLSQDLLAAELAATRGE